MISDGATFESLVQSLLFFEKPDTILFGRPGKDSGQDALSGDGKTVYQAKYHKICSMNDAITDALSELEKIKKYKAETHPNYQHWKNVESWILISNFSINPNDYKEWEKRVIPLFEEIGLFADYWSLEKLEPLLSKNADVSDNFFSGQNRNFLSLNEAYRVVTTENVGELMYAIDEIGRNSEKEKVRKFLENKTQNILFVIGFGGVGKTRFLYERGIEYSNEGWRILWANTETMTDSSDWFKGVSADDKVLILANEPENKKFISKCTEQLSTTLSSNWKIIITVRSPKDPIINNIQNINARHSQINLEPFQPEDSKKLIQNLYPTLTKLNVKRVISICDGYPVWIGLAIQLLKDEGSTKNLPTSSQGLVNSYLSEIEQNHDESLCSANKLRSCLQWIALFKICNIENSFLLEFLEQQTKMSTEEIIALLNDLTRRQLLRNWGVNKRFFAIKPDVIRDHILKNWLIDETSNSAKPSLGAKRIVELLLNDSVLIPNLDTVLTQLARTEYMNFDGEPRILTPLFEELEKGATNPSVLIQKQVIHIASEIGFLSPENVIDTFDIIIENVTEPQTITDQIWGDRTTTHKQIVDNIPEALYKLIDYLTNETEADKLLKLLKKIYLKRYVPKEYWGPKIPESDIIQRMIKKMDLPEVLLNKIILWCNQCVKELIGNNPLQKANLTLAKLLLSTFLDVERESLSNEGMSISIQKHIILPNSRLGKKVFQIRNDLKKVVSTTEIIPHRVLVWEIISLTKSSLNRAVGTKTPFEEMLPWQKLMRKEYKEDLSWCLETLEKEKANMSMSEWSMASELWGCDIKFSKDEEIKKIAKQCEDLYKSAPVISEFQLNNLFGRFKSEKEADKMYNEITTKLLTNNKETLVRFVDAVDRYVIAKKRLSARSSYGVAFFLGEHIEKNKNIKTYIEENLSTEDSSESHFNFAMEIIRSEIRILRLKDQKSAITKLQHYIDLTSNKILFISKYYSDPNPQSLGEITNYDVDFFKNLKLDFDLNQSGLFFDIIGVLYLFDPIYFINLFKIYWNELKNDFEKQSSAMHLFIDSIWITWLRYKNSIKQLKVPKTLLVDLINISVEHPSFDLMFHIEETTLIKENLLHLTLEQFNSLLKKRIDLSKTAIASKNDFQAMPFSFKIKKWVSFDPNSDEEQMHQLIDLSLEHVHIAQDIPQYAVDLDENNIIVPNYIQTKLENLSQQTSPPEIIKVLQWSRFAACYKNDSNEWRKIAKPACTLASTLPKKNRIEVFHSLQNIHEAHSRAIGSVNPYYEQKVNKATELLDKETEESLKPYREWMLECSKIELQYHKERVEEDFNHD